VEPNQALEVVSLHPCEQLGNLGGDSRPPHDGGLSDVDELVRGDPPDVLQLVTEDLPEGLRMAGAAVAEVAIETNPVDVGISRVPGVRGRRVLALREVAVLMRRIPGPDDVLHARFLEYVVDVPPGGNELSGSRPGEPPRVPPAVHLVPEG